MSRRKRFGEILVEAAVVNETALQKALERQQGTGKRLGQVLEEMGVVSEKDIAVALGRQFGFKTVRNIAAHHFPAEVLKVADGEMATKRLIFPLKMEERTLYLAMVNPLDMETLDSLSFQTGLRIIPCVTTPSEIQEAVNRHYLKGRGDRYDWWTVLVVDDHELVRSSAAAILKKEGYQTLQATNGAEGLKVVFQNNVHLIILDTVMPRLDGYGMYQALQGNGNTRNIPVIGLSSRCSPEEEAKLLEMGYFDFLAKPINPVRLTARVKRALKFVYGDTPPAAKTAAG